MTVFIIPALLALIAVYGLYKEVDVFSEFLTGARQGLQITVSIAPTLIGLLTAVYMLRASGCIDLLAHLAEPLLTAVGIPADCAPLMLLKPISGSGGLAIGSELIRQAGAESEAGRIAAVMLSASETSLYTIGLYAGSLRLPGTRYAVPAALIGDLVAFLSAAWAVHFFF